MSFLLDGDSLTDPAKAGGKASALAKLATRFEVPGFIVIAADSINESGLDAEQHQLLQAALQQVGPGPYAVRSSGREEDGVAAAHAGQFETVLDVPAERLSEAVLQVWRSGFSESLAAYRRAHGLSDTPQPPAVLVQQMIAPRAAGVAFSADPVSGARDRVVISAVAGLADRLVSGEQDGDQYQVDAHDTVSTASLAGNTPVLSAPECIAVARLARRTEKHFGRPQDIEWAIDDRGLHLLQSRPITTLAASAGDTLTIWDNANIVESYPGLVSTLTFSFARYIYAHVYRSFSLLMGVSKARVERHHATFANLLGRIDGRVYYNLLNWYRVLALFPGFKANREFMEGMMGAEPLPRELAEAIAPPVRSGVARWLDRLNFARVAAGLGWHQLRLRKTIREFYSRLNTALATPDDQIANMTPTGLATEYRNLESQLLARWDAPLINDFLCMVAFGVSRKTLERWAGAEGLEYHADSLIGQGDIISAEPARLIREMGSMVADQPDMIERLAAADARAIETDSKLHAAYQHYLARFGDRCAQELKLESLTLHDDPAPLLRAIAAAARTGERNTSRTTPRLDDLFADQPVRRRLAGWLMGWAQRRVRDRENLRFERTRVFGRVRRLFVALGQQLVNAGKLHDPRDVFHLEVEELLGVVEGTVTTADIAALAALRASELQQHSALPDPPPRIEVRGAVLFGPRSTAQVEAPDDDANTRTGLGCCPGVITAPVRVVRDPRIETLQAGEILVAQHTDPGWIALFAAASGVIAERGSLLSHSAIVAREMGVPCVVALKGVTQWLRTGDTVRLDGATGTVTVVNRSKKDD